MTRRNIEKIGLFKRIIGVVRMVYISHRGNINGIDSKNENTKRQIVKILRKGYDCEIDVWFHKGKFRLGHDKPGRIVDVKFLLKKGLWIHAKNVEALYRLLKIGARCFMHFLDDFTLTSDGYVWTYPGCELTQKSICNFLDMNQWGLQKMDCAGICSDYIERVKRAVEGT
jgi:hypothetical protein